MFEEMLPEDTKYLEDVLKLFQVTNYKLSETPTRFKIIIHPNECTLKTLHDVQDIRNPVGIEVDLKNGIFLECLKSGSSRKKRKISLEVFKADMPEKYKCGKFDPALRIFLGIEDICDFETSIENDKLVVKKIECLSYPVLKRVEQEGFDISFNLKNAHMTLVRANLL